MTSLSFLANRRLAGIGLADTCYVGRFRFKGKSGNVIIRRKQQMLGKDRDQQAVLVTKILLQVDVFYKLSERLMMNDS